jgi:O-antigen ligase
VAGLLGAVLLLLLILLAVAITEMLGWEMRESGKVVMVTMTLTISAVAVVAHAASDRLRNGPRKRYAGRRKRDRAQTSPHPRESVVVAADGERLSQPPDGGDIVAGGGLVVLASLLAWWLVGWRTSVGLLLVVSVAVLIAVSIASLLTRSLRRGLFEGCRWTLGFLWSGV